MAIFNSYVKLPEGHFFLAGAGGTTLLFLGFGLIFLPTFQWIGLRENLQESPILNGKIYGFRLRFSLKPIH